MKFPTRRLNRVLNEETLISNSTMNHMPLINRRYIGETGILPQGSQLICDTWPFKILDRKNTVIEWAGKEEPVLRVTGLFQEGDLENANGRVYSTKDVLSPAVSDIQEDLKNRAVMGEYDHPTDAKIHLDRISHLITKVWLDNRKVYGEAEILHRLPHGACLRGLFEHKVRVGISSRGVGDMEMHEQGGHQTYRVMPGYAFVTWDAVAEPSVRGAILNLQESLHRHMRKEKPRFSQEAYDRALVREIHKYFNIK